MIKKNVNPIKTRHLIVFLTHTRVSDYYLFSWLDLSFQLFKPELDESRHVDFFFNIN